jgi:uncharacterized protein
MSRLNSFLDNSIILPFPGFRQTFNWNCGTTSLNMILAFYGHDVNEDELIKISGANKKEGTPIEGLKIASKKYGLRFKEDFTMSTKDLRDNIDNGFPSLIMIQAWSLLDNPDWDNEWGQGHYIVNIGYTKDKFIFADPMSIKRVYVTESGLNSRWHGHDDNGKKIGKWGLTFLNKSKYMVNDIEEMG